MIRLLKGTVESKDDRTIILLVNNVGYLVFVTNEILASEESELSLFIHTHIREDELTLYGFRTKKELKFFELLLSVNGVGPKMALEILSTAAEKIQKAIFTGNIAMLTSISGIGKKIAERIILELKSKMCFSESPENEACRTANQEINEDAIITLEGLGYKRQHIQTVLANIEEDILETEDLIRLFLQRV